MANIKLNNTGNLRRDLGNTLIQWIRRVNEKNLMDNSMSNSYKNKGSYESQYRDLLPIKIKNKNSAGKSRRKQYDD